MIIDISNEGFRKIFNDPQFELPIRWDGGDYAQFLKNLYDDYIENLCNNINCAIGQSHKYPQDDYFYRCIGCVNEDGTRADVKYICRNVIKAVKVYNAGFPSSAYGVFDKVMKRLIKSPIKIYHKCGWTEAFDFNDPLHLYRVVNVNEDTVFPRSRVFHTPYNLRSKVSTSRYSIAGYPSLYLGTSVDLCLKELKCDPQSKLSLCSRFQINRNLYINEHKIDVIELAIKPQDFFEENFKKNNFENNIFEINKFNANKGRHIALDLLRDTNVRKSYLRWYPLIAACSFIRAQKSDPFAPEYVIPQLLMQWLRNWNEDNNKLFGLRYFSCASQFASDLGFNYVFPTSGMEHSQIKNYCNILVDSFKTTKPEFVHEYESVEKLETHLNNLPDRELDYIYN